MEENRKTEEEKERIFERMLEPGEGKRIKVPSVLIKIPIKRWLLLLVIIGIVIALTVVYLTYPFEKLAEKPSEKEIKPIKPAKIEGLKSVGSAKVVYKERDGHSTKASIYWPLGEETLKHPGVVLIGREGIAGWNEMYGWLCEGLAANGYVAMVFEPTHQSNPLLSRIEAINGTWSSDLMTAINYLTNKDPFKKMVDGDSIGVVGHSFGGVVATMTPQIDDRIKAVVVISKGDLTSVDKLTVPIQIISGDLDLAGLGFVEALPLYEVANPPKQLIMIKAGTGLGFTTFFGPLYPRAPWQHSTTLQYTTAWFDYFLKRDDSAMETLITPVDSLSTAYPSKYTFEAGEVTMGIPREVEEQETIEEPEAIEEHGR